MEAYRHIVQYYETDKMGITHHSNYIRWMEEARVDFLDKIGWNFAKLEQEGIVSPVVETHCKYVRPTTFSEEVLITASVKEFKGIKLVIGYSMENKLGEVVCEGSSVHCFTDRDGKILRLKKQFPDFYNALESLAEQNDN